MLQHAKDSRGHTSFAVRLNGKVGNENIVPNLGNPNGIRNCYTSVGIILAFWVTRLM